MRWQPATLLALPLPAMLERLHLCDGLPGGSLGRGRALAAVAGANAHATNASFPPRLLIVSGHRPFDTSSLPSNANITLVEGITRRNLLSSSFTAAVIEDHLAWCDDNALAATLAEAARVLAPGGTLAIHELCWRQQPADPVMLRDMTAIFRRTPRPRLVHQYWSALETAGFAPLSTQLSTIQWFDGPRRNSPKPTTPTNTPALDPAVAARIAAARAHLAHYTRFYGCAVIAARRA